MNSKIKILLIEDDMFLQQLYIDILTQEGYNVEVSGDGNEAFDKILQGGWNLVLLDVMLPKITGFEIMGKLSKDSAFKKTFPIVFMSNMDNTEGKEKIIAMADGYIIKSDITPPDLVEKVKEFLK
jgi:DNA-binding response OmpR family regulator